MKKRLAAFAALFVLVILAACAGAQETITFGGGSGYLGFVGDDGRLSDIKGISLALQLEAPLDEHLTHQDPETGKDVYSWDNSLLLTAPVVADQDVVTGMFAVQWAHRLGKGDAFLAAGPIVPLLRHDVLEALETGEPSVDTALYGGAMLTLWMGVPVGDATLPIQLSALVAGHLAGIPEEYERPTLVGFQVSLPRDLLSY